MSVRKKPLKVSAPSAKVAQVFIKSLLPKATTRKKRGINGIWEVFSHPSSQVPLCYGFTIEEARQDAAVMLGYMPPTNPVSAQQ